MQSLFWKSERNRQTLSLSERRQTRLSVTTMTTNLVCVCVCDSLGDVESTMLGHAMIGDATVSEISDDLDSAYKTLITLQRMILSL